MTSVLWLFSEGDPVQVLWRETGDYFAGRVQRISANSDNRVTYDVLYEERVRGKLVTENNVAADRLKAVGTCSVSNSFFARISTMVGDKQICSTRLCMINSIE